MDIIQVTQFAPLFDAFGAVSAYNSSSGTLSIKDVPKGSKGLIDRVLEEIKHFDDTRNYVDGAAALCIADFIDGNPNPLDEAIRANTLQSLGLMKEGKYIHQVLMLQKNNRAWHFSDVPNDCAYFGEECTHRGVNPNPEHKGRRSNRKPEEYHPRDGKGQIKREQLVTSALEEMCRKIPEENLVRSNSHFINTPINLRAFKKLPVDEQLKIISDLQESIA